MRARTNGAGSRQQVLEQVGIGAAVAEAAERGGGLGAHLVLEVAEAADEHREGARRARTSPRTLAAQARARVAAGLLEQRDQRIDHQRAVAGEDVRDARREPDLGGLERLDQRVDRARVGDAGQRAEGDLAHVAVLGAGGLHGLEQRRHRLGVADPAQQLGGEGALPPLPRGAAAARCSGPPGRGGRRRRAARRAARRWPRACSSSTASSASRSSKRRERGGSRARAGPARAWPAPPRARGRRLCAAPAGARRD